MKVDQRKEHFTRHAKHLNVLYIASAAKLIVNLVNSIFIQKKEKTNKFGMEC